MRRQGVRGNTEGRFLRPLKDIIQVVNTVLSSIHGSIHQLYIATDSGPDASSVRDAVMQKWPGVHVFYDDEERYHQWEIELRRNSGTHVAQLFRNVDICSRAQRVIWTSSTSVGNWIYLHRLAYTDLGDTGMINADDSFKALNFWGTFEFREPFEYNAEERGDGEGAPKRIPLTRPMLIPTYVRQGGGGRSKKVMVPRYVREQTNVWIWIATEGQIFMIGGTQVVRFGEPGRNLWM